MTDLADVRWIAGGTAAGKSTVARLLAERHGVALYDGDRAERSWDIRPDRHPCFTALLELTIEQRALRSPQESFAAMPSLHGETIGLVVEDLLAMPAAGVVVDWFGCMPRDVAPLLTSPEHAVFLLPTEQFRRTALSRRFADPARARANWGDSDHQRALAHRLARDTLWDAEVRRQAAQHGLSVVEVDGSRGVEVLADELAERFGLLH